MPVSRPNIPDLVSSAGLALIGGFVLWEASSYPMGTLRAMGPGYFPIMLGLCLIGLAAAVAIESLKSETPPPRWPVRAGIAIVSAMLAFALLIDRGGLIPATFALIILSSLAERQVRPVAALVTAVVLSIFTVTLFIQAFNMRMTAIWWF